MKIPLQYNRVMPYMIIPDAAGFIVFMKEVFGAKNRLLIPVRKE